MNEFRQQMVRLRVTLTIVLCLWGLSTIALCQVPQPPKPAAPPEVRVEDDPTKPILFSIRNEYRNLKDGAWANSVLLRVDKLTFKNFKNKNSANGLIFRIDITFNTVHRQTTTRSGLGDIYGQVLYIPYVRKGFALAVGSGLIIPTATDNLLGQGKVIVAPAAIPIWFFAKRRRFFLTKFQNFTSVAGNSSRENVNYFIADPTIVHAINRKWWITANTEFKWDWRTKRGSGISGLQFGRMVRRKNGFWLKPEIPWGRGRQGDFNLKFTVFRLR